MYLILIGSWCCHSMLFSLVATEVAYGLFVPRLCFNCRSPIINSFAFIHWTPTFEQGLKTKLFLVELHAGFCYAPPT